MPKKTFDCVEMKRKGAERVYEATKGMTVEQEVEFWRQRTAELRREILARKQHKSDGAARG
jgi:hypothetical protein